MKRVTEHAVAIEFCIPCDFRPQALDLTRELINGWADRLGEVALHPSSGGRFEVTLDGELIFSRASLGRDADSGEIAASVALRLGPPLAVA